MAKAILYARQSAANTDRSDADNVSTKDQLNQCREKAAELGLTIKSEYTDLHLSGATYPTGAESIAALDVPYQSFCNQVKLPPSKRFRPGLGDALKDLDGVDVLIVRDITRLYRPEQGSFLADWVLNLIASKGVKIVAVQGGELTAQGIQGVVHRLQMGVEAEEKARKLERVRERARRNRDTGRLYYGPHMFGYRTDGHQKVRLEPAESKYVPAIFDTFIKTGKLGDVARMLVKEKVPTMRGGRWWLRSVKCLLQHPEYAGYQRGSDGQLVEAPVYPKLITLDVYRQAQKMLAGLKSYTPTSTGVHPLANLCYCGYCGERLKARGGAKGNYGYQCATPTYQEQTDENLGCRLTLIRERSTHADNQFTSPKTGLLDALHPLVYKGFMADLQARKAAPKWQEQIRKIQDELDGLDVRQNEVSAMLAKGDCDMGVFRASVKALSDRRKALTTDMEKIQEQLSEAQKDEIPVAVVSGLVKSPDMMNKVQARRFIEAAVSRIDVYGYHVKVTLTDGESFVLERVAVRNARTMPTPAIGFDERHMTLDYIYPNGKKVRTLYKNGVMTIRAIGETNDTAHDPENTRRHARPRAEYIFTKPFEK